MEAIVKELESRKADIQKELEDLIESSIQITDWNVPEADNSKVVKIIIDILQEKLDEIKKRVS